ncbi:MAG: cytochrome C oxidase subunit IV family protein [Mycolicibacterium sp.]|uniref:cytochrome C oxidase subunit IV family protein n=1 Tax=Mycolicibacterium sp. TaxID=2320850 RepID=UPI003D0BAA9B
MWIVLIATMVVSLFVSAGHTFPAASTLIVLVAFTKVWLIGNYFMELNRAPKVLQCAFGAYVVVTCATLVLAFYRW